MENGPEITFERKYRKMFLLTSIGIAIFSCQNKENNKQQFQNIEISADSSTTKSDTLNKNINSDKKANQTLPDSPKTQQIKFKKPIPIVCGEVTEDKPSSNEKPKKDNSSSNPKALSNLNAEFPGGIEQFHNFFMKEYKKPEGVSYWKLNFTLAFAVEKNGSVSFLECSPAVEEPLEKEIIRVLSLCPKWQPGESDGKKIRMQYSVPILLK